MCTCSISKGCWNFFWTSLLKRNKAKLCPLFWKMRHLWTLAKVCEVWCVVCGRSSWRQFVMRWLCVPTILKNEALVNSGKGVWSLMRRLWEEFVTAVRDEMAVCTHHSETWGFQEFWQWYQNTWRTPWNLCCKEFVPVAVSCSELQWVAVSCSELQCVAVSCSELQWVTVSCSELQSIAVSYRALQWVAVCCRALRFGAVSCNDIKDIMLRGIHVIAWLRRFSGPGRRLWLRSKRRMCAPCSVSQCVAVRCSMSQCVAVRCSMSQCVTVFRSVLQCVAVCRRVLLQCVVAVLQDTGTLQDCHSLERDRARTQIQPESKRTLHK